MIDDIEFVRTVAVARITMPRSMVRLSAGRESMSEATQALCFVAGANSIFTGDKLLTTANAGDDADAALFAKLGLKPMAGEEPMRATPSPRRGEGWGEGAQPSCELTNAEHPHPALSLQGEGEGSAA
jgi:biotin synthase